MTSNHTATQRSGRRRLMTVIAIIVISSSVWTTARMQHDVVAGSIRRSRAADHMLTAMLDQETGLRGYLQTGRDAFLEPYRRGIRDFDAAVATARPAAEPELERRIDAQVAAARSWQALADRAIADLRAAPDVEVRPEDVTRRKLAFDEVRERNADVQAVVADAVGDDLERAELVASGVVLGLVVLFGAMGYVSIERQAARNRRRYRREAAYRDSQTEFEQTMQVMRDEHEAYELVKTHLERTIPDSVVTVLNRNNSDNHITAVTPLADGDDLVDRLRDATPDSCLAIRLGRTYNGGAASPPLLSCALCAGRRVTCMPSLVSGEVIGSVHVRHEEALREDEPRRVADTVRESSAVLANLRNLAIAELRAATDALTGLPNARACHDTLKRMVAQVGRTMSPLSAVLLDLDHFKQVNDQFGHGAGDDVLAATGAALRSALRESDFAGRYGGEEFLLLLPDTDTDGAVTAAEKIRAAISRISLPQVSRTIAASLGVATLPDDAGDADTLMRQADRALYAAKAAGRNRVEVARLRGRTPTTAPDPAARVDAPPN